MGFRFHKSIKLLSGIKLNLSKRSSSLSLGDKGATINVGGKKGTRTTVGLPGTGLSYSSSSSQKGGRQGSSVLGWVIILAVGFLIFKVFS